MTRSDMAQETSGSCALATLRDVAITIGVCAAGTVAAASIDWGCEGRVYPTPLKTAQILSRSWGIIFIESQRDGRKKAMHSFPRFLVLACSLLLVLPPGWCCFPVWGATSLGDCADTANVCSCCRHQTESSPGNQEPEPKQPVNCPCDERISTTVEHSQVHALDLSLPTLLAHIAVTLAPAGNRSFGFVGDTSSPAAEPLLHLLHCLWLC
jgi:hypothetical protein